MVKYLTTILLSLLIISTLHADDKIGFFDEDFVVKKKSSNQDKDQPLLSKQLNAKNVLDEIKGIKAYSLGLVVNGYDQEHFMRQFRSAIRTATDNDLTITSIIAVGLIPEDKEVKNIKVIDRSKELLALGMLDGKLYPTDEAPKKFNILKSPTWFINTAKGSIIIEGKEEIWELFNSRGEYVAKSLVSAHAKEKNELSK